MIGSIFPKRKKTVNRRAFLYGAGGIAIGLPFLEGLPERSAWAQDAQPIFTFFMCAAMQTLAIVVAVRYFKTHHVKV